jgi:hypothetical protein
MVGGDDFGAWQIAFALAIRDQMCVFSHRIMVVTVPGITLMV